MPVSGIVTAAFDIALTSYACCAMLLRLVSGIVSAAFAMALRSHPALVGLVV